MKVKYPRTSHLPWSLGATDDDKVLQSVEHFIGKKIVITEKMDGENTSLYTDGFHARSLDSRHHSSRDWLAAFHATIGMNIPEGWRVCGENVFAQHSITYSELPSYFLGFSIWDNTNTCLSWEDTLEYFEVLGITPVPTLFKGSFSEALVKGVISELDLTTQEGVVVRLADSFSYTNFSKSIAKFVRKGHVTSDKHWMHQEVISNTLAK